MSGLPDINLHEERKHRVLVNGFGRVGRALFRILSLSQNVEIVAINDPLPAKQLQYLLKYDSVMNRFFAETRVEGDKLFIGNRAIALTHSENVGDAEIKAAGAQLVVNSSGRNNDRASLDALVKAGAKRVVVSKPLPAGICDRTIMMGVNNADLRASDRIISAGSCTAHCYAPLIKMMQPQFAVRRGYMMTVHAYTSGQNIVDGGHSQDARRGRAAAHNIVPTTTESLVSFEQVMPDFKGKLVGMAQRVPVVDGSNVELILELEKETTREAINEHIYALSEHHYARIVEYTEDPIVSSDIIGNPHSCVFDSQLTHVHGGKGNLVRLIGWYDNEWGYANRLAELLELCAIRSVVA
ncbi:MAG: type I glyceraldehyde-3-phosphate dehydrogenase [Planctomycetes bacterium]|nr:type I glyceraldehyde-3-phosphate dehydrogenase [Planctomycetota bacterium]